MATILRHVVLCMITEQFHDDVMSPLRVSSTCARYPALGLLISTQAKLYQLVVPVRTLEQPPSLDQRPELELAREHSLSCMELTEERGKRTAPP